MDHPKILYKFPECAGESWMPSNGTEGMEFTGNFCDECLHERWSHYPDQDREEDKCKILNKSMIDPPVDEWQYDEEGYPHCTKWVHFDWGDEDDPNEPGDDWPFKPIPTGPNQLSLFPLSPNELDFNDKSRKIQAGSETGKDRKKEVTTYC